MTTKTIGQSNNGESANVLEPSNEFAETIQRWAKKRGLQRLRSDRRLGYPDEENLASWSRILEQRCITNWEGIIAVLDAAMAAATRSGEWRSWAFLTLQVQLAAERAPITAPEPADPENSLCNIPDEDPTSDWALAKNKIRHQIGQIPFLNWFEPTRQVERRGGHITVAVPNETSRLFIETDYRDLIKAVLSEVGVAEIDFVIPTTEFNRFEPGAGEVTK